MRIIARVEGARSLGQAVKRRNGEIKVAFLDQFGRLPIEEGDQKRGDMSAVDVRVGHDDDLVVAEIGRAVVRARAGAERLHKIRELLILRELIARG